MAVDVAVDVPVSVIVDVADVVCVEVTVVVGVVVTVEILHTDPLNCSPSWALKASLRRPASRVQSSLYK